MTDSTTEAKPVDVSPVVKICRPVLAVTLSVLALVWSSDLLRTFGVVLLAEQVMAPMLGIAIALVYLHFPVKRGTKRGRLPWYDGMAAFAGLAAGGYLGFAYPDLIDTIILMPTDSVIVGVVLFVLCLEGLRRTTGYALLAIVVLFCGYTLIAHLVPGPLQLRQIHIPRLVTYLALDTNALMGFILKVATTIVFVFVIFGQLLMRSGGAAFFNDFALALMGRYRGGSAKISITASSMFGSVSGIVVSNILATGVVTIPMMKRNGFPARLAAAVEAVASTGGQLMPPVMGAVAFLMADFLGRPYKDIVIAALVPSLLYYVALFIQADLEACRRGITRIEENLIPAFWSVMKSGWYFFLPFAVLIYALFWLNWQAEKAAIAACIITTFIGLILGYKGQRMSLKDIYDSLHETGISILDIMMIVAGASFIIGVLQVSGLGFALTSLMVKLGSGNLFLMLLLAGAMCIVLGMGLPTIAVYVLLAALIAPSLVAMGITPIGAHMFILYLGMMSFLTPPVAIAAYFAANLAKAEPMATGWVSMRFGWTAYVVPFLFVFAPSLLLQTPDLFTTAVTIIGSIAGVWMISAAMIGYLIRPAGMVTRVLAFITGILLLIPMEMGEWAGWTDVVGAIAAVILIGTDYLLLRRRHTAEGSLPSKA